MENIRRLVEDTHPILHERCNPIRFNEGAGQMDPEELRDILFANMEYWNGYGLSANQIGLPYRAFSMLHEDKPMMIINPRIVEYSNEMVYDLEGCLTYPGLYVKIKRPKSVHVIYYDIDGSQYQAYFADLSGRIFLHEMDHMMGNIFYDEASRFHLQEARKKRKINLRKMKGKNSVLWQSHINNSALKKNTPKTSIVSNEKKSVNLAKI